MPTLLTDQAGASTVTVLIAAYNAGGFIERAINSALSQEPAPLEILIVDDASTDRTVEVVQKLAAGDHRIKIVALPVNVGPARARNAGLDVALGDWVAVLDADDAYMPGRLEALLQTAESMAADLVADNFFYYDASSHSVGTTGLSSESPAEIIDVHKYISRCQAFGEESDWGLLKPMFRRQYLDSRELRYPEHSRHGEDFLFVVDILLTGARYALNREPYYLYTTRESGMSRTMVDYDAMCRQSMQLLEDPRVRREPTLRRLIEARIVAIQRLSAERKVVAMIVERDVAALFKLTLESRWAARAVLRRVLKRISPILARD